MLCFDRHIGMLPHDKMLCTAALIPQARTRSSLPPTRQNYRCDPLREFSHECEPSEGKQIIGRTVIILEAIIMQELTP